MLWTPHFETEETAGALPWQWEAGRSFMRPVSCARYVLYFPLALSAMAVLMWLFPSDELLYISWV
jgi:hypothetical protein